MENTTVLIIEDSSEIQILLEIPERRFKVVMASDGSRCLAEENILMSLFQWMMPLMSRGFAKITSVRHFTPVRVNAKAEEHDKLQDWILIS